MFLGVIIAFLAIRKKLSNDDVKRINQLRQGTQSNKFSMEVFYQKFYIRAIRFPLLKRYVLKIRRRLEINNLDDEFLTRSQTAKIIFKSLIIVMALTAVIIFVAHSNFLLLSTMLLFELFIVDTLSDGMVNKIDDNLLQQQIDFFGAMRHSYHETNMVGEAIYVTAQDSDHIEISRQAENIFEILNSSDPETELEKYYDVAPNNYLKEFAGISYLTQEFGDRKMNGESLYLRNLENITQEMQLEILKRDKLNYTFQSLSVISIVPMLILEPLKSWAVSNFSFTKSFYEGKSGLLVQILIIILTFACYLLVGQLKDSGQVKKVEDNQHPWQDKLYQKKIIKKFVDMFIPKKNTADYRKQKRLLKDAASKAKIEWVYINRLVAALCAMIGTLGIIIGLHAMTVDYVYTEPTTDYDLLGDMSVAQERKALQTTEEHNQILEHFKGKTETTQEDIEAYMATTDIYADSSEKEITKNAKQIYEKLQTINGEYLQWFETLITIVIGFIGYMAPMWLLKFQVYMRKMSMEDEVMSYQVVILMLMRLERVDVEMILEWLERYADYFKDPISRCLNNYEAGAFEALEQLKDDVTFQPFIRIIESLESAVERVPIRDAFEELDSDRDYYKEKRKETNERLIKRKGMIGKVLGFAPMVVVFVGYLIVPLVFIGMTSMSSSMTSLSSKAE